MRVVHAAEFALVASIASIASVVGGCSSIGDDVAADSARVAEGARSRLGTTARVAAPFDDETSIANEIRPLVAADLTEDAAVRIALVNSPSLRVTLESLGLRRVALVQAGLLANPVLSANAKFFSSGTELEFGLSQSILDLFLVPLRQEAARSELAATEAEVTREIVHLVHEVRRTYHTVLAAQQLEALAREVLAAAEASHELMSKLGEAGNVPAPSVTSEAVNVARTRLEVDAAHLAVLDARANLDLLLGLRGEDTHWTAMSELDADPLWGATLDDIETRAVASSLDLAKVAAEIESAGRTAHIAARQSFVPMLDAGVAGKREADGEFGAGPSLGIALPFFDTGAARVAWANGIVRERLRRQIEIATEIEIESRRLRDRLTALSARARDMRADLLPTLDRLVHETLQNYNAMQIGAFEVLEARHHEMDAKREYIETLRDAWYARIDLDELLQGALARRQGASTTHDPSTR